MLICITGAGGTLGSALKGAIINRGDHPIAWDRVKCPPDNSDAIREYLYEVKPDLMIHAAVPSTPTDRREEGILVMVNWPKQIAAVCKELAIPFMYISTVMVYTSKNQGPYNVKSLPDETKGYGHEKLLGEQACVKANPDTRIVRLGWQIQDLPEGNSMTAYLQNQFEDDGLIRASTKWIPACSYVEDSAEAILAIPEKPGVYLLDGNHSNMNFYDIACSLSRTLHMNWRVEAVSDFIYNQRMEDNRIMVPDIATHLITN
jgi:dTDP-4-dehydrorhamnose reductase